MRFSILCTPTDSCDKTQLMRSTPLLCLLFASKYDLNGSRLNYSTVSKLAELQNRVQQQI